MRVRLLQRLQQHPLVLVAEATDVDNDRDPSRPDRGFEIEECLQRQLVKLRRLVRQEPYLVDRKRLDPVVFPVVGMSRQRRLGQESRRQRPGGRGLAEAGFADEEVRVREPVGVDLRAQLIQCLRMADDAVERIGHCA